MFREQILFLRHKLFFMEISWCLKSLILTYNQTAYHIDGGFSKNNVFCISCLLILFFVISDLNDMKWTKFNFCLTNAMAFSEQMTIATIKSLAASHWSRKFLCTSQKKIEIFTCSWTRSLRTKCGRRSPGTFYVSFFFSVLFFFHFVVHCDASTVGYATRTWR